MTTDVSLDTAINLAQKTQSSEAALGSSYDQFLVLLTTQLQHQDPLEPMDTQQFTQQLVQYSQIEQQIAMNEKLDAMVQLQLASASNIGLNYVGMEANYVGSDFHFDGEEAVDMTYVFDGDAFSSKVSILDENGNVVYSEDGQQGLGPFEFSWDGRNTGGELVEPGTYSISVGGVDASGEGLSTTTVVSGIVDGIESQNGVVYLLVGDRAVSLSSVINATVPDDEAEAAADTTETTDTGTTEDSADETSTDETA